MIKQLITNAIGLFILSIGIFGYSHFSTKKSCDSPIQYKIGTFDTRFGISEKDFLSTIEEASSVWEKPLGKNMLEYNPHGDLTINLIYDERQRTTQHNEVLKADLDKINELASTVKEQYFTLASEHDKEEQNYNDMLAQFKKDQDTYTAKVNYWNTHGGAPEKEYSTLAKQKEDLMAQYDTLGKKRTEVNALVDEINVFIQKYNLLVNNANTNVEAINRSAGKEFEEGIYDPVKRKIDIYEFSTQDKLLRVITHELGHALGLPHNDNPESIMYALNEANTSMLSKDDLGALETRCVNNK